MLLDELKKTVCFIQVEHIDQDHTARAAEVDYVTLQRNLIHISPAK